jgi:hypothetical protein
MGTPLQLFNATLTLVTGAGSAPDYDRAEAAGPTKFTGAERVFWVEAQERATSKGFAASGVSSDVLVERHLMVDPRIGVAFVTGDIVTVTRDGAGAPEVGHVQHVATAGTSETGTVTRLILEDA